MLRIAMLTLSLALLAPQAVLAQSIEGVWRGTETEVVGGPNAGVTPHANPWLLIYTEGYVMWAFDTATEPRQVLEGDGPSSDAEIGSVTRFYNSVAGTYERDGLTLRYSRIVTLNPSLMLPENQPQVREIRRLTVNILETQATNDEGVTTILKYTRVE